MNDQTPEWRCKCGAGVSPTHPDRCARGHGIKGAMGRATMFVPENNAGLTHGLRAVNLPPEQAAIADYLDAYIGESLTDVGGASEIGVRERSQHHNRAIIQRSIHLLAGALETKGLFDRRGKLRVAWLQRLEGLVNTAKQLDTLLGLERRPRPIHPLDAVRAAVEEANK